jgi:CRP-like cAMP-binding protein
MDHLGVLRALADTGLLSSTELEEVSAHLTCRELQKGECLIKEGQVCGEIVFLESGLLRSFYVNPKGDDITYCVTFEKNFISAYSSYISGAPAVENIEAMVGSKVSIIQKEFIEKKADSSLAFSKLMRFYAESYILEMEGRLLSYQNESAKDRYVFLLENYPHYIGQISKQHLASYLGISSRHLNRISKEFIR